MPAVTFDIVLRSKRFTEKLEILTNNSSFSVNVSQSTKYLFSIGKMMKYLEMQLTWQILLNKSTGFLELNLKMLRDVSHLMNFLNQHLYCHIQKLTLRGFSVSLNNEKFAFLHSILMVKFECSNQFDRRWLGTAKARELLLQL